MYKVVFERRAVKDVELLKRAGLTDRAKGLIEILRVNPWQNPPPFEALVGNLSGFYSRRINFQHRLVYQVYREPFFEKEFSFLGTVKIIRMWSHYEGIGV